MSNRNKLATQPSATLQQKYNDVCFRLGQEIANERRSQANQETLKDEQEELEAAYIIAKSREQEADQRKQRDDKNKADAAQQQAAQALAPTAQEATQAS